MIGVRGPKRITVLEPRVVPTEEVSEAIILRDTLSEVSERYYISRDEIIESIQQFITDHDFQQYDVAEFICSKDEIGELTVVTTTVSDLVFLCCVSYGESLLPEEDSVDALYTKGVAEIIRECLFDVSEERDDYIHSDVHKIVYRGFSTAYGDIDIVEAKSLLNQMDGKND